MSAVYSLRRRLLVALTAVIAVQFVASAVFYWIEVHETWNDLREWVLQGQARDLLAYVRVESDGTVTLDPPATWTMSSARPGAEVFYALYDQAGRVVSASAGPIPESLLVAARQTPFGTLRLIDADDERWAVTAMEAPRQHVLTVGEYYRASEWIVSNLLLDDAERLAVSFGPLILGCLALVWLVTAWSLRPLVRVSREAALVDPSRPEVRISAAGLPSEIRPVVDAVNGALDRLARAYDAERRSTADAAHELRTPLAVLSLRLERAKLAGTVDWPAVERELAQLGRVVGQLMDLARKERRALAHDDMSMGAVNLSRVVREAAAAVLPLAENAGRSIDVQADETVSVIGHADDLRDMLRNLLDNALVHGAGAIGIELRTETTEAGPRAVIVVSDEGAGVPEALREALFDRFRKGRANSPGAGLGLAIARQVARTHGGDIGFMPGPGCRAFVVLPALSAGGNRAAQSAATPIAAD